MEQLSNSGSYDVKNYADLGSLLSTFSWICIIQSSHLSPIQ